jgi:hypothetical protein
MCRPTGDVSFATNPKGPLLLIDGQTLATPKTLVSWEDYSLNVNSPSPQGNSGKTYAFMRISLHEAPLNGKLF